LHVREQKTFLPNPCEFLHLALIPDHLLDSSTKLIPWEAGMTVKFADGTHIEIAAAAFDDFVKHDLKWAEFVHGRATVKKLAYNDSPMLVPARANLGPSVHPCPAGGC
jgi:hypothetical protein